MNDHALPPEIARVRASAELLFTPAEIDRAVERMAGNISTALGHEHPLLLGVMTGGIVPLALLLPRLDFPLQVDYVHASRYGQRTRGGETTWIRGPSPAIAGRTVLIIDDLLDRGVTLQQIVDECRRVGAARVLTAVLLTKTVANRPGLEAADFSGLTGPDRYVFGYGMDFKTYWRNAPGIFAVVD